MDARALTPPVLCLVTDGSLTADDPAEIVDAAVRRIRRAAEAGVDLIQVRERRLDDGALVAFVRRIIVEAAGAGSRVLVNDRADIAVAAGAAGVHLRGTSYGAAEARQVAGDRALIGRSVHSVDEAVSAERGGGLDYLVFGTVFPTGSKPPAHQPAGVQALEAVCRAVRLPVLAIGGITADRAGAVAAAGAAGVAAIGMFARGEAVDDIVQQVRRAWP